MGMAIKNGLGESGFTLWDDWSQEADNYNAGSARDVWKSIKSTSGGYTLGTLYYEAAQLGFDLGKWRTQPSPTLSPEQLAQQKALVAAKGNEQKATHAKAAQKAHEIWRKASPVSLAPKNHPYLVKKGFSSGPEAKTHLREMEATALSQALGYTPKSSGAALTGRVLVVPVVNADGIATLEIIDETGRKTALAGGKKAGAWYPINGGEQIPTDSSIPTVIVEGVATALSVDAGLNPKGQTPKAYVAAALSDTNLKNVAVAFKQLRPHADIIIGADSNSVEKARDAAAEVGGRYTYPKFHDSNLLAQVNFSANNQGKSPTDFNDLMVLRHETNADPLIPEKEKISFTDEIAQIFANARSAARGEWNEPKSTIETAERRSCNPPTEPTQSTHNPPIEPTLSKDKIMETQSHQKSNAPMYDRSSLPSELTESIAQEFGKAKINVPKESGTYRGTVHELKGYLVQEVGSRSLVVHDKSTLDFKGSTQNANDNKKLDGWDVQIFYGDKDKRAGVYTHDPEKEAFDKAVKSLKITANQQGKGEFAKELGKVAESAWEKTVEFRKSFQKKSEPEKPSDPQAAKAAPAAQKNPKR